MDEARRAAREAAFNAATDVHHALGTSPAIKLHDAANAAIDAYEAALKEAGYVMVLAEPTEAMVKSYLEANTAYWYESDALPSNPTKWRNGTPAKATAASLKAMIAAYEKEKRK